jgi:hypothetical protein
VQAKAQQLLNIKLLLHPFMVVFGQLVIVASAKQDFFHTKLPNGL